MDWRRFIPKYWMQNYPTCYIWDDALNNALNEVDGGNIELVFIDAYTVKIGSLYIWTSNWPHTYGHPYAPYISVLPAVETRKRLRDAVTLQAVKRLGEQSQ